jgi:hypothetical protein
MKEGPSYLVFFTGLGIEGAVLSNVLQSDDKINLGTKTYIWFLLDEGVLGLVLGFLGESLVGLECRVISLIRVHSKKKKIIPWNKSIVQFRNIFFDHSFLATMYTKRYGKKMSARKHISHNDQSHRVILLGDGVAGGVVALRHEAVFSGVTIL